ncbi:MAG: hypothetical protein A2076_02305 [Geobacteraceae bacterium GWC2_53_11]|nr:MAG: hypothetical protein A2076_02305 [Geobacteraceae bacterium GWC2_53_11]
MKTLAYRLTLVVAYVMLLAMPVRSAEKDAFDGNEMGVEKEKSECLLVSKNCATDSIQERIERVTNEIKRGTDVYTPDELKRLEMQLNDYEKQFLIIGGTRG